MEGGKGITKEPSTTAESLPIHSIYLKIKGNKDTKKRVGQLTGILLTDQLFSYINSIILLIFSTKNAQ